MQPSPILSSLFFLSIPSNQLRLPSVSSVSSVLSLSSVPSSLFRAFASFRAFAQKESTLLPVRIGANLASVVLTRLGQSLTERQCKKIGAILACFLSVRTETGGRVRR